MTKPQGADRTGLLLGIASYSLWGVLPLYLHLLQGVPALQVLSHRVLWSLLLLAGIVVALRRVGSIARAARGRTLLLLIGSAALIAINWLVYIWSVQHTHVLDASLGYFVNPLVNVALGMLVLGERLRRWQGVAIGLAALGVLLLALHGVGSLWIPLALALSFGGYGLLRKVAAIDALGGLTVETLLLGPPALAVLLWAQHSGTAAFGGSTRIDLLLIAAGVVTATPLLLFAAAAKRLPYATMGLLQYIAPTLQFLEAVVVFGEPVLPVHLATFALIWSGCALYAWDSLRAYRAAVRG
ncbi:EamA family transporter RarD [uncultured Sphingomonas sp.]|uniref:EamA family transporter RarD n=1 Tax=uncultured Sphingomonas sp. TaxID=158754 RepID=UPI0025DE9327|nr:EamA family transporter RarD [uncultured Sphingomonas sp.]